MISSTVFQLIQMLLLTSHDRLDFLTYRYASCKLSLHLAINAKSVADSNTRNNGTYVLNTCSFKPKMHKEHFSHHSKAKVSTGDGETMWTLHWVRLNVYAKLQQKVTWAYLTCLLLRSLSTPGTAGTMVSRVRTAPSIKTARIWVPSSMPLTTDKFRE